MASERKITFNPDRPEFNPVDFQEFSDPDATVDKITNRLQNAYGAVETYYSNSLSRENDGFDFRIGSSRYMIYPLEQDSSFYQALEKANISHFPLLNKSINQQIGLVSVPLQTRALDSMRFKEQGFTQSYIGAFEIMAKTGQLLAKIYKNLGILPRKLRLVDLAIIGGRADFISIVPPFRFGSDDIQDSYKSLKSSIEQQDPNNSHDDQLDILLETFDLATK